MEKYLEKTLEKLTTTKSYLLLANSVLVVFGIWFANVGILPFKSVSDFLALVVLVGVFAIYRPGWAFLFFTGSLVLESVNLAPQNLGIAMRPYQLLAILVVVSFLVQYFSSRKRFAFPKWHWADALVVLFALSGFISAAASAYKGMSFKQALVAASFVLIYFLARIFVQTFDDLKRVAPFFLSSALVVGIYAVIQNVLFLHGVNSFEVMPGRPNGTFPEADWLGIWLVFSLAAVLSVIYFLNEKTIISKEFLKVKFLNYSLLSLILVSLILTVSRSAWLGAVIVILGFLKLTFINGSWKMSQWHGKKMLKELGNALLAFVISLAIVYVFGLTRFQLGGRAASTGGLQQVTIACAADHKAVPQQIGSLDELALYGCRHINLEDIEKEKNVGNEILTTYRPDPNVGIRARIYKTALAQIQQHPIFGIGWGSISKILGADERGAGLNASNIFLEVWLGAGALGLVAFVVLLLFVLIAASIRYMKAVGEKRSYAVFILLGWVAVIVPNLFNSGIFLGFVWAYLAVAISVLNIKNSGK
ncbi:MAG TPA: O-antigen ligase family protein [Patescibacteria group bacterium]